MLKCSDCATEFEPEEASTHNEPHEFWGHDVDETFMCCPNCGGQNIEVEE